MLVHFASQKAFYECRIHVRDLNEFPIFTVPLIMAPMQIITGLSVRTSQESRWTQLNAIQSIWRSTFRHVRAVAVPSRQGTGGERRERRDVGFRTSDLERPVRGLHLPLRSGRDPRLHLEARKLRWRRSSQRKVEGIFSWWTIALFFSNRW